MHVFALFLALFCYVDIGYIHCADDVCNIPLKGEFNGILTKGIQVEKTTMFIVGHQFTCERQENDTYIFRASQDENNDLLMCVHINKISDDAFVADFQTGNMLTLVMKGRKQTLDETCNVAQEANNFEFFTKQGKSVPHSCPSAYKGFWKMEDNWNCSSKYQIDGCEYKDTIIVNLTQCNPPSDDEKKQAYMAAPEMSHVCFYHREGETLKYIVKATKDGNMYTNYTCTAYTEETHGDHKMIKMYKKDHTPTDKYICSGLATSDTNAMENNKDYSTMMLAETCEGPKKDNTTVVVTGDASHLHSNLHLGFLLVALASTPVLLN